LARTQTNSVQFGSDSLVQVRVDCLYCHFPWYFMYDTKIPYRKGKLTIVKV
jgi:hypothetical protein